MANGAQTESQQTPVQNGSGDAVPQERSGRRSHAVAVFFVILVAAAIGSVFLWNYYSVRESTDDAEIEGPIHPISARIGGTVLNVLVRENQLVEAGQVLVELDSQDYQVALKRAEADLAEAEATLAGNRSEERRVGKECRL